MSVRSNLNWSMTVVTITIRHTKKSAMPQGPCVATHGISPSIILILSYWKKFCAIYGYYWNREDDGDVIKDPLILRMISMCVGDHDRLSTIPFCRVWVNLLTMGGWGFGPAVITSLFVFFWRYNPLDDTWSFKDAIVFDSIQLCWIVKYTYSYLLFIILWSRDSYIFEVECTSFVGKPLWIETKRGFLECGWGGGIKVRACSHSNPPPPDT